MAKVTPTLETDLGYKLFLMFATINIGGMAVFSLWVPPVVCFDLTARILTLVRSGSDPVSICVSRLIPETKGRSLEEMDVIFGAVQADKRRADIAAQARGRSSLPWSQLRMFKIRRLTLWFIL